MGEGGIWRVPLGLILIEAREGRALGAEDGAGVDVGVPVRDEGRGMRLDFR